MSVGPGGRQRRRVWSTVFNEADLPVMPSAAPPSLDKLAFAAVVTKLLDLLRARADGAARTSELLAVLNRLARENVTWETLDSCRAERCIRAILAQPAFKSGPVHKAASDLEAKSNKVRAESAVEVRAAQLMALGQAQAAKRAKQ